MTTRDHVFPKSLGGVRTVACCLACNQIKANMRALAWRKFREANPKWWLLYLHKDARRAAVNPVREVVSGDAVRALARAIVARGGRPQNSETCRT